MTFTVPLTVLMLAVSGLEAVLILTQEKSLSVSPGSNVKISCISSKSNWHMSWYQKKPGSSPRFLIFGSTRATGLESRFTYSKTDNIYLHIDKVTAEDEAVYYCACADCGADNTFGGGTMLNIARASSPPALTLLPPSQTELSKGGATLVCLAQGFHPDSLTVTWTEDGGAVAGGDVRTGEAQRRSDGTYSASSLLTLTADRWRSGRSYACQLTHPALTAPLSQALTQAECASQG
ncbi:immunoglobulin lambda-1 light chain-like [Anguilla rostrata]|uniref:immunoglobulin lambda-1 light chain-like n=1 Tax=Anguilla rostrata TaxID=7938 RepID=UPI0030D0E8EB